MKNLLLIIILISPFLLIAQKEVEEPTQKKSSINIVTGIALGSGLSKNYGIDSDNSIGYTTVAKGYPVKNLMDVNYRFGVDYQRSLNTKLSFKAGVRIASWNLKTMDYLDEVTTLNNVYLEIPLAIQYCFGEKKWQPYVEGGLNAMISVAHNDKTQGMSLAVHLGIGVQHQLSDVIRIYGQLSGRAQFVESIYYTDDSFQNVSSTGGYRWYGQYIFPYEVGLEFGIGFSF